MADYPVTPDPMASFASESDPGEQPNPNLTVTTGDWGKPAGKTRIAKAIETSRRHDTWRKKALETYTPQVTENPDEYSLQVRTGRAFRTVERKVADLFYQQPDVSVARSPLLETIPNSTEMAAAHATIVNEKLGEDGVNAAQIMTRVAHAYEVLGEGWTKLGYRSYTQNVTTQVAQMDPMTGQPQIDPMTGQPVMADQVVPVPIKTECYWEYIPVKQGLLPDDLRHNDFDKGPWIGWRGEMHVSEAKRMAGPAWPDDFEPGTGSRSELHFDNGGDTASLDTVVFTEVFYKSSLYRDDIVHPDHLTQIVWIEGINDPIIHRDCQDQSFDQQGKLTPDSLVGFPIHPLTIRVVEDSARVMSDVMVGLPITQELDKDRQIRIQTREVNKLIGYYITDDMPKESIDKVVMGPFGALMGLPREAAQGGSPIKFFDHAPVPPDNNATANLLASDYDQMIGVDAAASGTEAYGSQTATEANLNQANRNVRTGKEQAAFANFYIRGVTKFSTLIQRYFSVEEAAQYVGQAQAQAWDSWRKIIPTRLAFTMIPDSSLRNDTPLHRKQFQDAFSFVANQPETNRRYWLERYCELAHIDPSKGLIPQEQVAKPSNEPAKAALSLSMPEALQDPRTVMFLEANPQLGFKIPPELALLAKLALATMPDEQPPAGGKVAPISSMDKHLVDQTGGQTNTGVPSPQGPVVPPVTVQ